MPVLTCIRIALVVFVISLSGGSQPVWGLTPGEVLVVANRNAAKSKGIAAYYMKKRQIPESNLVLLWMTDKEACTREAYDKKVVPRVNRFLAANPGIRAIVTVYGVPLKIKDGGEAAKDRSAAFDSELALVKHRDYALAGWQPNPFYYGFKDTPQPIPKSDVMMVSRLDGSGVGVVRRIIDDSMEAEQNGISGRAYFDARWKYPDKNDLSGYRFYDRSIHNAARFHAKNKILPVVLDDKQALFAPGACPEAALYCGWYSLAKYVDSFQWEKGSVGYHIASLECATLRDPASKVWCKQMLDRGAAATIGPVSEPYVQAFPVPELFFNLLSEGYLTLVESYMVSLPFLSWKMVLVGDPLYRFKIRK